ncbi:MULTISPECIES: hypothetical protein [Sphingomonas]|uniref:Uncharacterized protein n=1 Tax=Sphingomonas leidyi TaxID=68569 RepID=A0A7X5V1L3_9SPHN|nr:MULTISPECIES: hypothetical protein [Sphingomonas]MBN8813283.1 hypothetical protein [Sphingomonas sp.]NIJ66231.1 hypothetical protein [Sphingomonas leidyi]
MNRLNKLVLISSAVVGSTFFGSAAMAQAAPNGVLNGVVVATKGITVTCDLKLTLDAANNKGSIEMNPGDTNCAALHFNNMPYTTSYSAGVLTFHNVDVTTITIGDCYGDISGTWDGSTLTISGAVLPPHTGGPACTVDGFAA